MGRLRRPHGPRAVRVTRRWPALAAVLALAAAALVWTTVPDGPAPVDREHRFLQGAGGTRLDTTYYRPPGAGPHPAVLLAHGFGGTKDDEQDRAQRLTRAGYAVLTYTARGFGRSGGRIALNASDGEVADVGRLVDWLAQRPEVRKEAAGDPVLGMAGGSYGGAVTLLAAARDPRIDALVPSVTYWDLNEALFPGGVFKKLWAGILFGQGLTGGGDPQCGRFTDTVCSAFQRAAATGRADPATRRLLASVSPSSYAERISLPTLVVQGQNDSLFPLSHGDAVARTVARNGAPVAVDWIAGGHDGGADESTRVHERTVDWFDAHLKERGDPGPGFRVSRGTGSLAEDGTPVVRGATASRYPGATGTGRRTVPLDAGEQTLAHPAGGMPPTVTAVPGLGVPALPGGIAAAFGGGPPPGRTGREAVFTGSPLSAPLRITGSATFDLTVRSDRAAVLFARLYDVGPDGAQSLPRQLVSPVTVAAGATVRVALPALDHGFGAGHRLRVVISSTDLGYASPAEPALHRIRVGALSVPTVDTLELTGSADLPRWVWVLPVVALTAAAALLRPARRRNRGAHPHPDAQAAGPPDTVPGAPPLRVEGLTKRYPGAGERYAVRDLSFTVGPGQVLGLLGPNGAGKTTTLRMLMGLITPDGGELTLFGHPVRPGAPVLSRLGSFVEGPGFLPHLTGRQNIDLYWRSTGRPAADAHAESALEIAALGAALDDPVRTYSQGMRQRLAIAQAMLGLPDLLVLDEPTNGLDPGQIREMRDVLIRYAAHGRSVVVSSHLLAEVEQCCTHLVVMDRGRLVTAGPVADIASDGAQVLVVTSGVRDDERLARTVAALPGVADATAADEGLLVRLTTLTTPALLAELVRAGVAVEQIGPRRRLEDAFLTLIGGDQ
ncbi:alpha/beta fold hydrolase [Streptomyces parvus]